MDDDVLLPPEPVDELREPLEPLEPLVPFEPLEPFEELPAEAVVPPEESELDDVALAVSFLSAPLAGVDAPVPLDEARESVL